MQKKREKYRTFNGYKEAARIASTITAYNLRNIAPTANWLQDCMEANGVKVTPANVEKFCRVAKALGFYAIQRRGQWIFGSARFEIAEE